MPAMINAKRLVMHDVFIVRSGAISEAISKHNRRTFLAIGAIEINYMISFCSFGFTQTPITA
jgi:hypothetical protein